MRPRRPTLANMGEPRRPRSAEQLADDLDEATRALAQRLEADGVLGVVVVALTADEAVVGCAGDVQLAPLWPAVLRRIASTIGAQAAAALERAEREP